MKYGLICILLCILVESNGQEHLDLQLKSVKTTLLELGNIKSDFSLNEYKTKYRNAKFILYVENSRLVIFANSKTDTIYLEERESIGNILDNEYLRKYPTDNLEECIRTKARNCGISKTLLSILEETSKDISYSIGKASDSSETNNSYFLFYLSNKRLALLSLNEFVIINLKIKTKASPALVCYRRMMIPYRHPH